ncbi:MAG: NAD(P)-dependent alcohol dehydrogenase [Acidimicrobiales bacterium]|nr:MAG: NAD(P)-dependent alcohol dehydrogenase [Acidimicrobiales bacterium]
MPGRSNRTAVMDGIGRLHIEERPVPQPGDRELLVEVRSVGVCGSDVHFFEHGPRLNVFKPPHVLGHEVSGVVAAHGPRATRPPIGTRVAIEPSRPCGICSLCRGGRYNLCPQMRYLAAPPTEGGFARYLTVPEDFAYPVPAQISDDAAALIEPLSVVVHAARCAEIGVGARVLVSGAGPIGLLMTQVARAIGAIEVNVSDINPFRLSLAETMGATRVIDVSAATPSAVRLEVDVFIECSGNPVALPDGIRCVRPGGVAAVVGMIPTEDATIPLAFMQTREIRLVPTFRFANSYAAAIGLVATRAVRPEAIITGHLPLDRVETALRAGRNDPRSVKTMITAQA